MPALSYPSVIPSHAISPLGEHKQFMKDIRFSILGYGVGTAQQPLELGKRIQNIVKFLTEQGGAVYLDKLPTDPCGIDIIIVRWIVTMCLTMQVDPSMLATLNQVSYVRNLKLNPLLTFVKGIDYLESCCVHKRLVSPQLQDRLFPNGGIVVITPDVVLQEDDIIPKVAKLLEVVKVRKTI